MLNAIEKFAAAAAWSIFLNLAMIGTLACARFFPSAAYAAAWGVFLAGVLQLVFITVAAARVHLKLHIQWPRWTPEMKEFLWALGAATIGSASIQISLFIDSLIASFLPSGDLTALYYADRINQLPMGTLGIALGTVLLPEMSNRLAKGDRAGSDSAQNRAGAVGLLFTLPFVAAYFTIPDVIMRGLFAHGAFHLAAADISAHALMAYGLGLPAFVLVRIVAPSFYARGDTATPVRATMISVAINIALKAGFVWGLHLGAVGIALGTALAAWANVAVLIWLAMRRGHLSINDSLWRALPPIFLAAAATGVGAYAGRLFGPSLVTHSGLWQDVATLGLAVALGVAGYVAVVALFRSRLPLGRFARA
jgi:putative peptidoglycan lipid II flippase